MQLKPLGAVFGSLKARREPCILYGLVSTGHYLLYPSMEIQYYFLSSMPLVRGHETIHNMHLLRDCSMAKAILTMIHPSHLRASFFGVVDVVRWICKNLSSSNCTMSYPPFCSYIFRQTIHTIWCHHKSMLYSGQPHEGPLCQN